MQAKKKVIHVWKIVSLFNLLLMEMVSSNQMSKKTTYAGDFKVPASKDWIMSETI